MRIETLVDKKTILINHQDIPKSIGEDFPNEIFLTFSKKEYDEFKDNTDIKIEYDVENKVYIAGPFVFYSRKFLKFLVQNRYLIHNYSDIVDNWLLYRLCQSNKNISYGILEFIYYDGIRKGYDYNLDAALYSCNTFNNFCNILKLGAMGKSVNGFGSPTAKALDFAFNGDFRFINKLIEDNKIDNIFLDSKINYNGKEMSRINYFRKVFKRERELKCILKTIKNML